MFFIFLLQFELCPKNGTLIFRFSFRSWIAHNPLECTKELIWLQTWMTAHHGFVRDLDQVTCETPYGNFSKVFDFDFSRLGRQ